MRNPNDCVRRQRASGAQVAREPLGWGLLVVPWWRRGARAVRGRLCLGAWVHGCMMQCYVVRGSRATLLDGRRCRVKLVAAGWGDGGYLSMKSADFTYPAAYMGT